MATLPIYWWRCHDTLEGKRVRYEGTRKSRGKAQHTKRKLSPHLSIFVVTLNYSPSPPPQKTIKPEDWYSIALTDLREMGFPHRIKRAELAELLAEKYPHVDWRPVLLLRGRLAQQKRLERVVSSLFEVYWRPSFFPALFLLNILYLKGMEIHSNVKKEANIVDPEMGEYLELDIWIPGVNLAIEYAVDSSPLLPQTTRHPLNSSHS